MENAVIYARFSSHSQRDVSIDDQVRECKEYASKNNMTIIKVYADHAITGKTDERKLFQQMMRDATKKIFTKILVYKNDRFARNRFDATMYKHKLKGFGIRLIAIKEPIPEGSGGIVMEALYESMAEMYSVNLAENIRRGQAGNALKCMANCMPPFGYSIDKLTRHYIIDDAKAPIIQRVFQMASIGQSYDKIKEYMESQGCGHSNNWIYRALQNKRYLGIYIYGDVVKIGGIPKLIDEKTFDAVQKRIQSRKRRPNAKPLVYILSGKMYCGLCNSMMNGLYGISHTGQKYRYYRCAGHKNGNKCSMPVFPAKYIEKLVLDIIKNDILNDDVINQIADATVKYQEDIYKEQSENTSLHQELQDVTTRINNLLKAIENGAMTESTTTRLKALEAQKNKLIGQIESNKLSKPSFTKEMIFEYLTSYKNGNINDLKYAQKLIDVFATKVVVFPDHISVIFCTDKQFESNIDLENIKGLTLNSKWWR